MSKKNDCFTILENKYFFCGVFLSLYWSQVGNMHIKEIYYSFLYLFFLNDGTLGLFET